MENANSPEYLEKIKNQLIENLKRTAHVPSVQMQDVPPDFPQTMTEEEEAELEDLDEDENKDVRMTQRQWENRVERDNEYEESDNEDLDRANGVHPQNGDSAGRKRQFADYQKSDLDDESAAPTPTNGNTADNVIKSKELDEVMEDAQPEKEAEPEGIAAQEEQLKNAQVAAASNTDGDGDVDMETEEAPKAPETADVKQEDATSPKPAEPAESPKPADAKAPEAAMTAETTTEDKEPAEATTEDKPAEPASDVQEAKAPEAADDAMEVDEPKAAETKPAEDSETAKPTEPEEASSKPAEESKEKTSDEEKDKAAE
jgi:histone deacetylase 1/2